MNAVRKLDYLENQIERQHQTVRGMEAVCSQAVAAHKTWLDEMTSRASEAKAELRRLNNELPRARRLADKEERLLDLAAKEAELAELEEAQRLEQAIKQRTEELRDQVAELRGTVGAP